MKNNPSIASILQVVPSEIKTSINEWLGMVRPNFRVLVEVLNNDRGQPIVMMAVVNVAYCGDEDCREEMLEMANCLNNKYRGLKAVISKLGLMSLTYRITYCCQATLEQEALIGLKALQLAFREIQDSKEKK